MKLDTIENILESRTLKANQQRDEVCDKPAELKELRATSEGLQNMYDQVVSFIRWFIDKLKPKQESNEEPPPLTYNSNLSVMSESNTKTNSADSSRITRRSVTCRDCIYLKESLKGEAATLESIIDSFQSLWAAVCKRYEIRRIIVDKHIDELIQIKPIRQEPSGELRHVLDVAVKNLRALETMELKIDALSEQVMVNLISNQHDVDMRHIKSI
jgi:hypothetical protein